MKEKLFRGVLFVFIALLYQQYAQADDGLIRVRASLGYSYYSLSLSGGGASSPDTTSQYLAAGGGITYATGNIYMDAFGSMSLEAEHDWPGHEGDFQRMDSALTLGYLLNGGWSVFGGYKWGKSEIEDFNDPSYKLTFEAFGFFGGVSKAFRLDNGSSISMSGALAFMDGDIYTSTGLDDEGDATGLSVTISYNYPLGQNIGTQFRGFYQNYSFDGYTSDEIDGAEEIIMGASAALYINF